MENYNQRLSEVDEILNYYSQEDLDKIPEDVRNMIKENKDSNYEWHYDDSKNFTEQGLSTDTIAILAYIDMKYVLSEEQVKILEKMQKFNQVKIDTERDVKENPEKIFDKNIQIVVDEDNSDISETISEEVSLVEVKSNIFTRIIEKIKNLFSNVKLF